MHMRVDDRLVGWYLYNASLLINPTRQRQRCYMRSMTQPITGTRVESPPWKVKRFQRRCITTPSPTLPPASSFRPSYDNVSWIAIRPAIYTVCRHHVTRTKMLLYYIKYYYLLFWIVHQHFFFFFYFFDIKV